MVSDPYKILGVSPNASNDEIKKAYRELLKKYHPDNYTNNPLSDLAEEKFKQIHEAYTQIMSEREKGSEFYSSNFQEESTELKAVYNHLSARHYREALSLLDRISNKTARWYYYSALANAGVGNNIQAYNHIRQAVNMEPSNQEYLALLNQIEWSNQRYQSSGYRNRNSNYSMGNFCCDLWCADTLCECMGGDLCSCF